MELSGSTRNTRQGVANTKTRIQRSADRKENSNVSKNVVKDEEGHNKAQQHLLEHISIDDKENMNET